MSNRKTAVLLGCAALLGCLPARGNLTFNLIPDPGMPQYAVDGFTAAANLWSSTIANNITVNLQIGFSSLAPNVIAETSSNFGEWSYNSVRAALWNGATSADDTSAYNALQSGGSFSRLINRTSDSPFGANSPTPYVDTMNRVGITTANAKALGLQSANNVPDGLIRFSSAFAYDFTHGQTVAPGQIDFIGAAAHEIGHALGFISGVDDIDTSDGLYPGDNFSSNLIDLFRFSEQSIANGNGFTDYTADNRDKFFSVDGGLTPIALMANGYFNGDGAQASHWKDSLGLGIMDPTAGEGEVINLSAIDLRLFDVLGYTLVPEPGTLPLLGLGVALLGWHWRKRVQSRR